MGDRRPDGELVAAALRGDQEAFGELMARHERAVRAVAARELGDLEAGRDAAQDTFVKAYLNLTSLRSPDSFGHWVRRIAQGTARDERRRRRDNVPLEAAGSVAVAAPADEGIAGEVRRALDSLPAVARRAVTLHYLDGCSHAEIARLLGLTPGAVKVRLCRARARLRKELAAMVQETLAQTVLVFSGLVRASGSNSSYNIGSGGDDSPQRRLHLALMAYDAACSTLDQSVSSPWAEERREGVSGHLTVLIADGFRYGAERARIVVSEQPPPQDSTSEVAYAIPAGTAHSWSSSGSSLRDLIHALAERGEVVPSESLRGKPTRATVSVGDAVWELPVKLSQSEATIELRPVGVSPEAAEAALSERVPLRCRDLVRAVLTQAWRDGASALRVTLLKKDSTIEFHAVVGEEPRLLVRLGAQSKLHSQDPQKPGTPIEHPLWHPLREAFAALHGAALRPDAARQTARFEFVADGRTHHLRTVFTPKTVSVRAA